MKLTVIIPTKGRPSLKQALASAENADEIVVAHDRAAGPHRHVWTSEHVKSIVVYGNDHGYTARTAAIAEATGTHLAFLDDDDVYTPDAISLFREHACDRPVIFRMLMHSGVVWRDQRLTFGNVGTPTFLVPNIPDKLGEWRAHRPELKHPGGDYTFIAGCCQNMGHPVWREEIVALIGDQRGRLPDYTVEAAA